MLLLLCLPLAAKKVHPAQGVALDFIKVLDSGKYEKSYDYTAAFIRTKVDRAQWGGGIAAAYKKLGKVSSRKHRSSKGQEDMTGGPKGSYWTVDHNSTAGGRPYVERVILFKESGAWKVVGYALLNPSLVKD